MCMLWWLSVLEPELDRRHDKGTYSYSIRQIQGTEQKLFARGENAFHTLCTTVAAREGFVTSRLIEYGSIVEMYACQRSSRRSALWSERTNWQTKHYT